MNDPIPLLTPPVSSRTLLALTEAMEHTFDAAAWATLGRELDMPQLGDPEARLQEALRLRDDDYGYFIAQLLRHLQGERPSALRDIAHRPEVKAWLDSRTPDAAQELGLGPTQVPPAPMSAWASTAMDQALKDAHQVLRANGPVACVGHVHTALHRYLRDVCTCAGLSVADDATVAQLLESVRNAHPKPVALDQHPQVGNVLASVAQALAALDASPDDAISQPGQALVGEAEAMLMVALVQGLFDYSRARA